MSKDRVLTEEDGHEFRRANDIELVMTAEDAFDYGFGEGAEAQDAKTLKEVGEWLVKKRAVLITKNETERNRDQQRRIRGKVAIINELLGAFKQGEMPECH